MRHAFWKSPSGKEGLCLGFTISPDILCRAAAKYHGAAAPFSPGKVLLLLERRHSPAPEKGGPR